jgi:hypothetical protein
MKTFFKKMEYSLIGDENEDQKILHKLAIILVRFIVIPFSKMKRDINSFLNKKKGDLGLIEGAGILVIALILSVGGILYSDALKYFKKTGG